jgi:hypothetical protein
MFEVGKKYKYNNVGYPYLCVGSHGNLGWFINPIQPSTHPWTEQWNACWKEYKEPEVHTWYYAVYYDNNDDLTTTELMVKKEFLESYIETYCIKPLAILETTWVEE